MTRLATTRLTAMLIAGTALGAIAAGDAAAQPVDINPQRRARAKAHADAGIAAHDRGEYDAAIAHYQAAYDELPHPALFFNMAQSHRLAGRRDQALILYRRYLAEAPTGSLAAQAQSWIAALDAPTAPAAPSTAPGASVASPGAPLPPAPTTVAAADPGRGYRLGAYGAGAAGLVALGVGSLYGMRASTISDELSRPMTRFDRDRFEDGEAAETSMFVWYGIGGALLIGGAVLYVMGMADDEQPTAATGWAPVVGGDGGGVSWSTAF